MSDTQPMETAPNSPEGLAAACRPKPSPAMVAMVLFWLFVTLAATGWMARYSGTPGTDGAPPEQWPRESRIRLDGERYTLVMFVHPHCPCSRASLGELERLMADAGDQLSARIIFIQNPGESRARIETDSWRQAVAIPGATAYRDQDGIETRRFHSITSGQTALYDTRGHLEFHGGITLARGHAGDSPGRSAVLTLLRGNTPTAHHTPVFGCALVESVIEKGEAE